jgi:hypothetical protein
VQQAFLSFHSLDKSLTGFIRPYRDVIDLVIILGFVKYHAEICLNSKNEFKLSTDSPSASLAGI